MNFSESDTRAKFIDEQLKQSLWEEKNIIREYTFTDGRKLLGNKRGNRKSADYILTYKGVKLAIIEAKKYDKSPTDGLEQAKEYAKILHIRFVYATNGREIYEFDMETGKGDFVFKYPTPDEIFAKIFGKKSKNTEILLSAPFFLSDKKPRYYQEIAVRKTLEAIGQDQKRILLTLATGTGKTVIAFQLCYKLFEARFSLDGIGKRRPKILILADRNVLISQAMNTFNPMERDLMRINSEEIKKRGGKVPKNANIFFSIYQALVGGKGGEDDDFENVNIQEGNEEAYFKQYDKDFFDIIIIDECHRGGAKQDGNWAEILQYFENAIQIGLTATPKRSDNIDTYAYFGEPVYEYSLQAGIDDGFLTPFKIKRIQLNTDELVLTGADKILSGEVKKSFYTQNDMDKNIVIKERTNVVAQTILDQIGEMEKTIIFCENQAHAADMRDAINRYKTHSHPDYCVRVTSNEGEIGRKFLEDFQDNDRSIPVILTSSQMLTTGVDALGVKNIVLDRTIGSIVEYKQIVGRGTRIFDGKDFFTIYDFKGATNDFIDEIWDGNPENIEEIKDLKPQKEKIEKNFENFEINREENELKEKLVVELGAGREVRVINIETRYLDPATNKHLSTVEFLTKLTGELPKICENEHIFRSTWAIPETRELLLKKLENIGLGKEQFADLKKIFEAEKSDIFDILLHISYGKNIKNLDERAESAKNFLKNFDNDLAREFVDFMIDLYARNGILDFGSKGLPAKIKLFNRGEAREIGEKFGGLEKLREAYIGLQEEIYRE